MNLKFAMLLGIVLLLVTASTSRAQFLHEQSQLVGVTVGLNFTESGVPIGLNYEYMIKREIGIGAIFRYWTYSIPY
ncbi:MAG TPA: hypothetical protein VFJ29_01580, partial [Candidatus Kapabacteria bacterium]|nr:hypothetical protein [Candidatus Kapabacteria bacterium]